ncbi:MAG: hypothetical protein HRT89_08800 [Lentisphaeria bacterium]|nr:hypothetical protein [Lentisphaeria bacterium]NQZ68156.1 hypothetical protein [Lentisphaeria bacterium]
MKLIETMKNLASQLFSLPEDQFIDWKRDPELEYLVDLDKNICCGVCLGGSSLAIESLGRPSGALAGLYCYPTDGLSFFVEEHVVETITINFTTTDDLPRNEAFDGKIIVSDQEFKFGSETSDLEIIKILGEPDKYYNDTEGMGIVYFRGNTDMHFKFDFEKTLLYIALNQIGDDTNEEDDNSPTSASSQPPSAVG